jgi:hypothetical protein
VSPGTAKGGGVKSVFVSNVFVHIHLLLRGLSGGEAARFVSSLFSFLGDWIAVALVPGGVVASFSDSIAYSGNALWFRAE